MYDLLYKLDAIYDVICDYEFIINTYKYNNYFINSTNIRIFLVHKQLMILRANLVETRCRSPTSIGLLNLEREYNIYRPIIN